MPQAVGKCKSEFDSGQESKKDKTLEVTARIYMVSDGDFVNTLKINRWFFLGGFRRIFCHEFLILKSKLRDLNSRLEGCGICVSEIYFSFFLENNEGKRLK